MVNLKYNGQYPGLLIATICMIFSSYFVSIYFSLSFASGNIERVGLIAIAIACTTWAFSMHSVTHEFMIKKANLIVVSLIIIDAMTFIFQFHGWAGYSAELNANIESNSEFAQNQKFLIQTQREQLNQLNQTTINPASISKEMDELNNANINLITQKLKCPKNSWQCRVGFEQKINANKKMIKLKEQQFNQSAKNNDLLDRANEKLNQTLLDVLNNSGDYNRAHPVFQKMSYAINNDNKKAMVYQGRALGFLSLLLTILEATLPFYCGELCFDKRIELKMQDSFAQNSVPEITTQIFQKPIEESVAPAPAVAVAVTRKRLDGAGFNAPLINERSIDGGKTWIKMSSATPVQNYKRSSSETTQKPVSEPTSELVSGTSSEPTDQSQTGSENTDQDYKFSGSNASSERVLKQIAEPTVEFDLDAQKYAKLVELVLNRSNKIVTRGEVSGQKIRSYCGVGYDKSVAIIWQLYKDGHIDKFRRIL